MDALGQFEPGQARHFDVRDQQIRAQPLQFAPRRFAIGGGADDLDVRLQVQQRRQRAAHHRLILGQQHPDHAGGDSG